MIYINELDISVEDVSEYNDRAGEVLTEFCNELETDSKNIIKIDSNNEDHAYAEEAGWAWLWSDQASLAITTEIDRLYEIGRKYFGNTIDLDVSTHMYNEE